MKTGEARGNDPRGAGAERRRIGLRKKSPAVPAADVKAEDRNTVFVGEFKTPWVKRRKR